MKTIVHISDTHTERCHIPEGDILVHTGDWSYHGTEKDIQSLVKWLDEVEHKHVIVIAGNHDHIAEEKPDFVRKVCEDHGVIYLRDELVEVEGLKIWGSPWSNEFGRWAFMLPEQGLKVMYDKIPEGVDIIASHGPAYGILDEVDRFVGSKCEWEVEHVGSRALRDAIRRVKPQLVLSGHIHEAHGYKLVDGVHYLNSSIMTKRYDPLNKAHCIGLAPRIVTP